jgi:hypothetical protein
LHYSATTTTGATAYNQILTTFPVINAESIDIQQMKARAEIARMEALTPWAVYTGSSASIDIKPAFADEVSIPLHTDNGRVIIYFSCNALKKNSKDATVTITPYIDGVPGAPVQSSQTNDIIFQWSNSSCVAGKKVHFSCSVHFIGNNNDTKETTEFTILKSTSSRRLYDINEGRENNKPIAVITELPTK